MLKRLLLVTLLALIPVTALGQTINRLDQWQSTSTPVTAISQRVWGTPLKITGLTASLPLCVSADGIATTTGCSSGSFSYDAWTHPAAGKSATTSELWVAGLLSSASSTINSTFRLPQLSDGMLTIFGGTVSSAATTTAGTGLTYSGNAFSVNTIQNIAKLSNLTSNGFVKTSGGDGTLSVDTNSYITLSSLSGTSPISYNSGTGAISFLFNTNNTWTGTNLFQASTTAISLTSVNATSTNATTTNLYVSGLASTTQLFANISTIGSLTVGSCTGCSSGGITGLKGQFSSTQTGATQTFATSSDTNITLTVTSSGDTHTFAPGFTGTLADSRVANDLTISGGTVNGTPIGASSASTAIFTSSTSTSATSTNFFATTASTTDLQVGGKLGIGSSTPFTTVALGPGKTITTTAKVLATSTSMTVNWLDGNMQTVRIGTAATAISFSNFIPGQTLALEICNPGASGGAVTFTGVLWPGGTPPTTTTTANKCDFMTFRAGNGTSTPIVYGGYNQNY